MEVLNYSDALDSLLKSNSLKKQAETSYLIGKCHLLLGHDDSQVEESFLQAEFLDDKYFLALRSLGELYLK